jgi:predicted transposase YbfD/YdcC
MERFQKAFGCVPDPRAENARHELMDILVIALAAVLCGAESCADMADFGAAKEPLLRRFLRLEHGIPSHDTFSRVFRLLDPVAFEAAFRQFMGAFAKNLQGNLQGVVAIDGKALRGAFERGRRTTPLHLVNVWAAEARMAIAQRVAPRRNEVAAALEVLQLLSLEGCTVTADALHCHADMASAILARGGEYVLALKENQSALFADAQSLLEPMARHAPPESPARASHGRKEQRRAVVVPATGLADKHAFPGIVAVGRVELRRRLNGKDEPPTVRYFVLSHVLSPTELVAVTRSHWGIENQLHWVLDVVFDEDRARNRKDHAPENLALLRKLALNMLRAHPDKASIRRKIKKAGWDDAFLISMLTQMR